MCYFIVTIDTEGDNLWKWKDGENITTNNSYYLPRFQELCEKYNIKPVYLINYEMANDDFLVSYLKNKVNNNLCEVGMHCHAWNTPPFFKLENKYNGNPYITEYPNHIMFEKMKFMTELLESKFNTKIVTHRAGRWASNQNMFECLKKLGYYIDCSCISGMNLTSTPGRTVNYGFDYRSVKNKVFKPIDGIYEVPMTSMHLHYFSGTSIKNFAKNILIGRQLWMRTALTSEEQIIKELNIALRKKLEYVEFMIHSSELMPGGSPYFKDDNAIEGHFNKLENVFKYASSRFKMASLKEFINKEYINLI